VALDGGSVMTWLEPKTEFYEYLTERRVEDGDLTFLDTEPEPAATSDQSSQDTPSAPKVNLMKIGLTSGDAGEASEFVI